MPSNRWIDSEKVEYIYNGILFSYKIKICRKMDGAEKLTPYHRDRSIKDKIQKSPHFNNQNEATSNI